MASRFDSAKYDTGDDVKNLGHVKSLPKLNTVDEVQLEAIGSPPSALTIGAPPSLPVYIRRHTLLTLQANLANIKLTSKFVDPFRRLLYGNFASRFQEVLSSSSFTMMVSSNTPTLFPAVFRKTTPKSFATVSVDGTKDWAFLKRDALQVYTGPSLDISTRKLPSKISKRLSKNLNLSSRKPTGLSSWFKRGFIFVHGRGALGLVGSGLVYSATIAEGEEIAVNKNSLIGVSVNGPHDLQNCVIEFSNPVTYLNIKFVNPKRPMHLKTAMDFVLEAKFYYCKTLQVTQRLKHKVFEENQDFVRVIGPRSILLQSGSPQELFEKSLELSRLATQFTLDTSANQESVKAPSDYLNVVTVAAGEKATIQSVADFKNSLHPQAKQ